MSECLQYGFGCLVLQGVEVVASDKDDDDKDPYKMLDINLDA